MCVVFANSYGQDIHFSMFDISPMLYNPASTGEYDGDYRFSAIHRNQWKSVTVPFVTTSITAEVKDPFKKLNGFNFGVQVISDKAGDSEYNTFKLNLSAAYRHMLTSDSSHIISIGMQSGFTNRNINYANLTFDNQYNGYLFDATLPSGEQFNRASILNGDFNIGLSYRYIIDSSMAITCGVALHNITKPEQSLNGAISSLDRRGIFVVGMDYLINDNTTILPNILFSPQGKYRELIAGVNVKYNIKRSSLFEENVYLGIATRPRDAIILSVGLDYRKIHARLSYDINYSNLVPASNRRGGVEIGLLYIFTKVPNIKYKRCPDFI